MRLHCLPITNHLTRWFYRGPAVVNWGRWAWNGSFHTWPRESCGIVGQDGNCLQQVGGSSALSSWRRDTETARVPIPLTSLAGRKNIRVSSSFIISLLLLQTNTIHLPCCIIAICLHLCLSSKVKGNSKPGTLCHSTRAQPSIWHIPSLCSSVQDDQTRGQWLKSLDLTHEPDGLHFLLWHFIRDTERDCYLAVRMKQRV